MAEWARSYSSLKGISQICEIVRDFLFLDFSDFSSSMTTSAIEVWKYIVFLHSRRENESVKISFFQSGSVQSAKVLMR